MATVTEAKVESKFKVVGTRPVRHDGTDKVTGRAVYGADIQLPGLVHGKILRSPHAHARIKSIDTVRAAAHPGVLAVVTHADLPWTDDRLMEVGEDQVMSLRYLSTAVLADDKALHKGHPVAAVAASNPHAAEEALDLIEVEYEVLPSVTNVEDAMRPGAPVLHENITAPEGLGFEAEAGSNVAGHAQQVLGDAEVAFAEADVVVEREFRTKMVHQGYIEPQTCTALWGQDGRLTIWNSSQGQFGMRDQICRVLDVPVSEVKVVPLEIGGGFGGKLRAYLEPVAALLSKKTGHPVKITMSPGRCPGSNGAYVPGVTPRSRWARRKTASSSRARRSSRSSPARTPARRTTARRPPCSRPTKIDNIHLDSYDVVDNMPSTAAYRAPGAPIGAFAGEAVIDEIAEKLGIDPVELRLKNAAREGTRMANGVMHPCIGAVEMMEAVHEHPHYNEPLADEHTGRGVAFGSWGNGAGPACVIANLQANGKVSLVEGSVDIGGTRTAVSQQFAEVLGIPVEDVMPQIGDTDSIGYTSNTGGSSVAFKIRLRGIRGRPRREAPAHRAGRPRLGDRRRERPVRRWHAQPRFGPRTEHVIQGSRRDRQRHGRPDRRTRQRYVHRRGTGIRRHDRGRSSRSRHRQDRRGALHGIPGTRESPFIRATWRARYREAPPRASDGRSTKSTTWPRTGT